MKSPRGVRRKLGGISRRRGGEGARQTMGGRRGGKGEPGRARQDLRERTPGIHPQDGGLRPIGRFRVASRSRTGGHLWAGTGIC